MRTRIADSEETIAALLVRLEGSERMSLGERIFQCAAAAAMGILLPFFLSSLLQQDADFDRGWWAMMIIACTGPVSAYFILVQALATHIVTPEFVAFVSVVSHRSWRVERANIAAIDFESVSHGSLLWIVPRSGKPRSLTLLPGFLRRLGVTGDPGNPQLSPRLGRILYAILALVALAVLAALTIGVRRGLIRWY